MSRLRWSDPYDRRLIIGFATVIALWIGMFILAVLSVGPPTLAACP